MIESEREKHSLHSSIREEYVEYVFLGELCSFAWEAGRFVEIARSNTDAFGYDVILTSGGIVRHVQLKATHEGGRAAHQNINANLSKAPSGCVIWMYVEGKTLRPTRYGWFGASAGQALPPLGDRVAKHTKANAEGEKSMRPGIFKVSKSKFEWLHGIEEVFDRLFCNSAMA